MKKLSFIFFLLSIFLTVGCTQKTPKPQVIAPQEPEVMVPEEVDPVYIKAAQQKKVAEKSLPRLSSMTILGEVEPVYIKGMSSHLAARIDSGATTSSLNALGIKRFERDGKSWVSFTVVNKALGEKVVFERPVTRVVSVKRHGEEAQRRVVVKLQIRLGKNWILREFSLTDRSAFQYPVLIGRNVLSGSFIVDVSRKNITSVMQEELNDN